MMWRGGFFFFLPSFHERTNNASRESAPIDFRILASISEINKYHGDGRHSKEAVSRANRVRARFLFSLGARRNGPTGIRLMEPSFVAGKTGCGIFAPPMLGAKALNCLLRFLVERTEIPSENCIPNLTLACRNGWLIVWVRIHTYIVLHEIHCRFIIDHSSHTLQRTKGVQNEASNNSTPN